MGRTTTHSVFRLCLLSFYMGAALHAARIDVTAQGARGDARTLDTAAIQRAIDTAASNGGGTITFPAALIATHVAGLRINTLDAAYSEPAHKPSFTRFIYQENLTAPSLLNITAPFETPAE